MTDVTVQVERGASIGDLGQALTRHLWLLTGDSFSGRQDIGAALHCARLGQLDADDSLIDTGLRSGDIVTLMTDVDFDAILQSSRTGSSSQHAIAELIVHAGPQAGRRITLCLGRYVLGRDPGHDDAITISDPSVSRRHLQLEVDQESVNISDLGSSNGFAIEGTAAAGPIRLVLDECAQVEVGRSVISLRKVAPGIPGGGTIRDGSTLFNRQRRIVVPYRPPQLELEPAPGEATFGKLQLAGIFLPIAGGVSAAAAFGEWKLLLSTIVSPATLLWTYVSERRHGRRIFHRSVAQYQEHLDKLGRELELAKKHECATRRSASPDAAELAAWAFALHPRLWERRATDEDFLALRVGVADLPAELSVKTPHGSGGSSSEAARQLLEAYSTVPAVPVTVALPHAGSLGLIGPDYRVDGLGLWLALQAAVLHSPRELAIAAAVDPDQRTQWEWLKWLPHTGGEFSALTGAHLADDMLATQELMARVTALIYERRYTAAEPRTAPGRTSTPALVLFLDEDLVDERGTLEEILEQGPAVGVYTIWLGHLQRGLPGECRSIVALDSTIARLTLIPIENEEPIEDVTLDAVEQSLALQVARAIASLRDTGARGRTTRPSITDNQRRFTSFVPSGDTPEAAHEKRIAVAPFAWTNRHVTTS